MDTSPFSSTLHITLSSFFLRFFCPSLSLFLPFTLFALRFSLFFSDFSLLCFSFLPCLLFAGFGGETDQKHTSLFQIISTLWLRFSVFVIPPFSLFAHGFLYPLFLPLLAMLLSELMFVSHLVMFVLPVSFCAFPCSAFRIVLAVVFALFFFVLSFSSLFSFVSCLSRFVFAHLSPRLCHLL